VATYVVNLVEATRASPRPEAGASPRGSLALLKASRARAAMLGRSHVLPDDVKAVAIPCLAHRLLLQPDQWVRGVRAEQVIAEVVGQVPAPATTDPSDQARLPGAGRHLSGILDGVPAPARVSHPTMPPPQHAPGSPPMPAAGGMRTSAAPPTVPPPSPVPDPGAGRW
jgi:hypothetical protein